MTRIIQIKVRRVAGLLKALAAIDGLRLKNGRIIAEIAGTIDAVRSVQDAIELQQNQIIESVVGEANAPSIVTQGPQLRINPDVTIKMRLNTLGNEDRSVGVTPISAPELFRGEVPPSPAQVAELMCLLDDLDQL